MPGVVVSITAQAASSHDDSMPSISIAMREYPALIGG
jgi:hypothetical protein